MPKIEVKLAPKVVIPDVFAASIDTDIFSSRGVYILNLKPKTKEGEALGDAYVTTPDSSGYYGYAVPAGDNAVVIYVPSVPTFAKNVKERLR